MRLRGGQIRREQEGNEAGAYCEHWQGQRQALQPQRQPRHDQDHGTKAGERQEFRGMHGREVGPSTRGQSLHHGRAARERQYRRAFSVSGTAVLHRIASVFGRSELPQVSRGFRPANGFPGRRRRAARVSAVDRQCLEEIPSGADFALACGDGGAEQARIRMRDHLHRHAPHVVGVPTLGGEGFHEFAGAEEIEEV